LLRLKAVDKYVSNAVEAGATAFYNRFPRNLSHAFQKFSTGKPIIPKQILNVHRASLNKIFTVLIIHSYTLPTIYVCSIIKKKVAETLRNLGRR
jgi:hypothetical protein